MKKLALAAIAALVLGTGTANAASYCLTPATPDYVNGNGLSLGDVTFRSNASDGCYGVVNGNDDLADVNALTGFGTPTNQWETSVKDDNAPGTLNGYLGFNWSLSAPQTATSGTWTLSVVDANGSGNSPDFPVTVDMLAILKGGTFWSAYLFTAETFTTLSPSGTGTFEINFKNNGGQTPGLSHMTVFFRDSDFVSCPPDDQNCNVVNTPEPSSMLAFGAMLLGLVGIGARKRG